MVDTNTEIRVEPADAGDVLACRLLRQGKIRAALNRAKTVHKVKPSPAAEALLLRCYAARIRELRNTGRKGEAEQLEALVAGNFPGRPFPPIDSQKAEKSDPQNVAERRHDSADDSLGAALVRFAAADTSDSDRQAAANEIARLAFDPVFLAEHPALTAEHPLAAAAKAVAVAFEAVVSRPVDEAEIALPGISRRSPLAGWKLLIRAIAHLQRREDRLAGRALDGLAALDCAAARLVPPLRAIIAGKWDELDAVGKRIFSAWKPREKRLAEALRRVDAAFFALLPTDEFSVTPVKQARKREKDLFAALRGAAEAVRLETPARTPAFREAAATKMLALPGVSLSAIEKSLGGPAARTASFWRLAALAVEERIRMCGSVGDLLDLRNCWTAFLRHGVAEGLFPAGGAEEAEIWLHMADMAMEYGVSGYEKEPKAEVSVDLRYCYDPGQTAAVLALAPSPGDKPVPFDPMTLFASAAKANPTSELFRTWLEAARRLDAGGGWRRIGPGINNDRPAWVLEQWTRLLPNDPTPFLILMDEAEQRNALTLAQKHLAAAEAIDPLNADLTRAKWRLTLATCRRHLKQGKAHLVEADLKKLDVLRRFGPANAGWLLTGLHWVLAATVSDTATKLHAELAEAAGGGDAGECAAGLIEQAVAVYSSGKFFLKPFSLFSPPLKRTEDIVLAAARAFRLLMETGFGLAWGKKSPWPAWIASVKNSWPGADLPAVIYPLLPGKYLIEAFSLTSAGLADAGRSAETGRLLFLRAVILRTGRTYQHDRTLRCARAAFELGRRLGVHELTTEVAAWVRTETADRGFFADADSAIGPMADDELNEVLEIERNNSSFPKAGSRDPHYEAVVRRMEAEELEDADSDDDEPDPECPCPRCRRARGEPPLPHDDGNADKKTVRDILDNHIQGYGEHIESILREVGFSRNSSVRLAEVAAPEVLLALIGGESVGRDIFDFYQINRGLREKSLKIVSELPDAERRLFEEMDRRAAAKRATRPKKTKRDRRKKR